MCIGSTIFKTDKTQDKSNVLEKEKPGRLKELALPRTVVEKPLHDFGKVNAGTQVEHIFTFENRGKGPLKITDFHSLCSCTVAFLSKKIIPQGERGRVKITLDVPNKNTVLEQAVELYTNDPNYPVIKLTLKALASMPIVTVPPRIFLGSFFPEELVSKELIVRKVSLPAAKILSIRTSSRHLIAAIAEPDSNGDAKVTLTVRQNIPVGKLDEKLWIDYSNEGSRATLEIPIAGEALGDVRVFPQRFFFGLVEAKAATSKNVTLSRIKGDLLKILSVQNASKYVSTEIITAEEGNKYQIKATISPDAEAGELFDTVIVQTNHRKQPEIKIPLYCIVMKPK